MSNPFSHYYLLKSARATMVGMPVRKSCEVCGGTVQPVGDKSGFGYCGNCGLMYFMVERPAESRDSDDLGAGGGWYSGKSKEAGSAEERTTAVSEKEGAPGVHWTCPDCGYELTSETESDLGFLKVVHIREYHPNRPT